MSTTHPEPTIEVRATNVRPPEDAMDDGVTSTYRESSRQDRTGSSSHALSNAPKDSLRRRFAVSDGVRSQFRNRTVPSQPKRILGGES